MKGFFKIAGATFVVRECQLLARCNDQGLRWRLEVCTIQRFVPKFDEFWEPYFLSQRIKGWSNQKFESWTELVSEEVVWGEPFERGAVVENACISIADESYATTRGTLHLVPGSSGEFNLNCSAVAPIPVDGLVYEIEFEIEALGEFKGIEVEAESEAEARSIASRFTNLDLYGLGKSAGSDHFVFQLEGINPPTNQ